MKKHHVNTEFWHSSIEQGGSRFRNLPLPVSACKLGDLKTSSSEEKHAVIRDNYLCSPSFGNEKET